MIRRRPRGPTDPQRPGHPGAEGYYLSSYRLVCGNYTGCGVVEYGDAVTIEPDENGDYSAVTHVSIDENDFDHWRNVGGLGRNYPTSKPSEANWSNSYLAGTPFIPSICCWS